MNEVKRTQQHILRAMVMNYAEGHAWDRLDSEACAEAADEIAALEAECKRLRDELAVAINVPSIAAIQDFLHSECAKQNVQLGAERDQLRAELSTIKAQQVGQESELAPKQHPDDAAVDRFAAAMKAKLARSREKGRHGWQNCTAPHLSAMLYDHLYKADPLDVGNFAMMLHQNGQAIELPFEARGRHTTPQPAPAAQDVAGWISVTERLPEVAQEVIVSTEFEGVCAGILDSYGEWFAPCSEYKLTRVTHWMPLPAAPAHDKPSWEVRL